MQIPLDALVLRGAEVLGRVKTRALGIARPLLPDELGEQPRLRPESAVMLTEHQQVLFQAKQRVNDI